MQPPEFEAIAKTLLGATIVGVRYYTLTWPDTTGVARSESDWWDETAGGHRSTYGIDLVIAPDRTCAVMSDSDWPFGLSLVWHAVAELRPQSQAWDVSHLAPWLALIGQPIVRINVEASEQITAEGYRRLNDQYLARRWWLRLLWPLLRRWWHPVSRIEWENLGGRERVTVTSSVRIVVDTGQFVRLGSSGGDVLGTFGAVPIAGKL